VPQEFAYLFLEGCVLLAAAFLINRTTALRVLGSWRFIAVASVLFFVWFAVDSLAVWLGLWSFPRGRTLVFRLAGLPLEEILLFGIHSIVCLVLLEFFRRQRNP
jgi:lycopene cyclase domain-containing protein